MLSNETELTLLSAWTLKSHVDDIKLFESTLFTRPSWFEAVKNGKNYMQIRSLDLLEGMSIADVSTYADGHYLGAKAEALTEQRNSYIERAKKNDSQVWIDKAKEIQDVIDGNDVTPNATNLKELFFKEYYEERNEENPHYGFKKLDEATRGLHKGQLVTIGARPGIGKSAFGMQIANNVSKQDFKVIYIPLEMSNYQMLKRLLLTNGTVSRDELYNANDYIIEQIGNYLDCLEMDGQLILCENMNSISAIKQKIQEERPYVVVIDQLSLLYPYEPYSSLRERFIANTRELKRIALQERVAIVLMSQMNREADKVEIPSIENLSESDSVGQDSDAVMLLYCPKGDDEHACSERETFLRIAKQRDGISDVLIRYWFDGNSYQFNED